MIVTRRRLACVVQAAVLTGAAALAVCAAPAPQQAASEAVPSPNTLPPAMRAQLQASLAGLEQPGDIRQILAGIVNDNEQMKPLLDRMDAQAWYDKKGAPSAYILQRQMAQRQLGDVLYSAKLLSQKTDDLPLALDTYFRIEALEVTARSLDQGALEYGSRADADALQNLIARNFNNRQRLRDYLRDLAANLQQNFKIADEEAQRCRAAASESASRSRRHRRQ